MQHISSAPATALKNPPKTPGLPIIGSIPGVLKQQADYLLNAREHHGDIYTLDLGVTSILVVNRPEAAQYVLRDNAKNFRKGGAMWDSVRETLGNGLVVSEGDFWLRQRRMMQPYFHRQHLGAMTELMLEAIEAGMADWDALAEAGQPFDISTAFANVTMKVIVRTSFGSSMSDHDAEVMGEAMTYILDFMLQNSVTRTIPKWIPVPGRRKYQESVEKVDAFIFGLIEKRRQNTEESGDVLGMLLNLVDDETGETMTDQQIRDELLTLFLAGYETTALTLAWCAYYLTQNPDMMARLYQEVDDALHGERPGFETLMSLPYSRMVFQESMRIRPPAFWVPRSAIEDDEIDGFHIPAGQMVGVAIYGIHHHPDIWENPHTFDPERFTKENSDKRHNFAWIPFGAGQRLCLGRDFAMMEGALVLARLAQRYHLKGTDRVPEVMLSSTMRPKNGVWVSLEKRG